MEDTFDVLLKRRMDAPKTLSEIAEPMSGAVEAYVQSGDPDAVLSEEVREAANLLSAAIFSSPETFPPEILVVIASLRWLQHSAREGTISGALDRAEAIRLYEQVCAQRPEFVREAAPGAVITVLDLPEPATRRLVAAHDGAVELLKAGRAGRDRVLLREGIEILRRAVHGVPPATPELARVLPTLSSAWQAWHELTDELPALDQAIDAHRRAAEVSPPGAERANRHRELYALLHQRRQLRGGIPVAADEEILALRGAIGSLASDDEVPAPWFMQLARDLVDASHRTRTAAPAQEALRILRRRIADASGAADIEPAERLSLLADAYAQEALLAGDPRARDAERAARHAARLTSRTEATQPPSPCACTPPARERALPLSPELAYAFGLVVLDVDEDDLIAPGPTTITFGDTLPTPSRATFAWDYAAFRALQTIASPFLNRHALRLLRAGVDVVRQVAGARGWDEVSAQFAADARRLSRPGPDGISCVDLLESSAHVEAYRRFLSGFAVQGRRTTVSLYRELAGAAQPDAGAPERRGFAYLAERLGEDAAYELLAPLSFLAFAADEPVEAFTALATRAAGRTDELERMPCAELLVWAGLAEDYWQQHVLPVSVGMPVGSPFITDPLRAALELWEPSSLLEAFCRPATHLSHLPGDPQTFRHLLAPVILLEARAGELSLRVNGIAESRPGYSYDVIRHAGLVAAAERLTVRRHQPVEHRCWHQICPAFATGLCHRWYAVPAPAEGHDACGFHREFAAVAGLPASDAWHATQARAARDATAS